MEKATSQKSENIRLILIVCLCVLSFVAGAAYTKADLWLTLRHDIHRGQDARDTQRRDALATMISPFTANNATVASESVVKEEPADEWQTVQMRVTAYCPCSLCCGQYADGMTACGHVIEAGDAFVAADKRYAFGTEMIVPSYNDGRIVKVFDRGGAICGDRIDVFFPSHQEALEWGVKLLDVKVHTK